MPVSAKFGGGGGGSRGGGFSEDITVFSVMIRVAYRQCTDELVVPPHLPHLALLARLYHGVEATSCQAERNVSSLSVVIGTLRASMSPFKVERMIFLKLDQGCLPVRFKSTTTPLLERSSSKRV